MPTSDRFRPRRLLALATDSPPARAYLGLVAVGVAAMFLAPDSPIAMAPMMLTAPLSFLPMFVPVGDGVAGGGAAEVAAAVVFVGWMLLCALANAAALGALIRRPDRTPDHRPDRPPVQAPPARPRRALLAAAVDNWPARIYVAVVAAALGTFLYAVLLSPDPGSRASGRSSRRHRSASSPRRCRHRPSTRPPGWGRWSSPPGWSWPGWSTPC